MILWPNPETSTGTLIVKRKTQGIPTLKRRNGSGLAESELEQEIVSLQMCSTKVNTPKSNRSAPFMEDIHVSAEGVIKFLKGLNPSKALGPDELHPRVLKELASELGPMFAHLFQKSVDTGKIPNGHFKHMHLVPKRR